MSRGPTQANRVVNYLTCFGSITRVQALLDLGIANLPAVIDDLRHKKGFNIITDEVEALNRYEEKITYARYRFAESEDFASEN